MFKLKWYKGREVTEQEQRAIWEAIFPNNPNSMSADDIQYEIDNDAISLNTCRNGRDVIWAQISDTKLRAVYVDTLEELDNEEVEKELC